MERCPACGSGEHTVFTAREMLQGTREVFTYFDCAQCETLRIAEVPSDLDRFYPKNYYAYESAISRARPSTPFRRASARWLVGSPDPVARITRELAKGKTAFFSWLYLAEAGLGARVLDVGCGSGGLLRRMQRYGFTQLMGVDPYAPAEVDEPQFKIVRGELAAISGAFDVIMMHHVLEHLADPARALTLAREKLTPQGRVLVRLPIAGSAAHREFGRDWFNLDPPRHLVIPSVEGFRRLAEQARLRIVHTGFDSTEASFLMSLNYRADVSWPHAPKPVPAERRHYRRLVRRLNTAGRGDQALFVLAPQ